MYIILSNCDGFHNTNSRKNIVLYWVGSTLKTRCWMTNFIIKNWISHEPKLSRYCAIVKLQSHMIIAFVVQFTAFPAICEYVIGHFGKTFSDVVNYFYSAPCVLNARATMDSSWCDERQWKPCKCTLIEKCWPGTDCTKVRFHCNSNSM